MTSKRWRDVEILYDSAIELGPVEREQFLAKISDLSLRRELQSLLDMEPAAQRFFEKPVLANGVSHTAGLNLGTRIGPYVIEGALGAGGMGEVYKASDQRLGRDVALKFLSAEASTDLLAFERLEREARAASALNDPRICTLYDVGEHEGRPFLVMELLEGAPLKERLACGPLPIADVISIGEQITDALSAAHAKGIIHRDIKPTNIFVNQRGDIKLLDFGLAKLSTEASLQASPTVSGPASASDTATLSMWGAAYGTAPYMSPEQIRGEPVDARSDLFSVGVTLYEMATGTLPFRRDTREQLIEAITSQSPIPPRTVNSAVPTDLEAVILHALEKDRTKRYQSAADLNRDLTRLLSARSRSRGSRIAVVAVLGLACSAAVMVKSGVFAVAPRAPELTLRQVTANPVEDPVFRGSISPDGRYAAYSDLAGLHIRLIDTGQTRSIAPQEGLCFR